jgi:hypothetical protein
MPSSIDYCLHIFLWDSFGDYWDNLQFSIKVSDGTVHSFKKNCSSSESVDFCFNTYAVEFNLTIETINPKKPVRHGWEAFFKYVDQFTGKVYYGHQGSVVHIRNTQVVGTTNLVNLNPEYEGNECNRCNHPEPKKKLEGKDGKNKGNDDKDGGDSNSKPKSGNVDPSTSPPNSNPGSNAGGSSPNNNDNGAGTGGGNGGPGNGAGSSDGGGKKPIPPLEFPFILFDQKGDGWYKGGNQTDVVCPGEVDSSMPSVITYPRYYIVNSERTTIIHKGTICGAFRTEACQEILPHDGKFVFRVAGYDPNPSKVSWEFCGKTGILGEELQFEMVKGKCVPVDKRSADDYCKGIESISVWSGSLLLLSSSSLSSSSIVTEDSKVLEQALSEVLFDSKVIVESLEIDGNEMTVSFTASIILEKLGYVGIYSDELETSQDYVSESMESAVSNGVVYAAVQHLARNDPSLASGVVIHTKSVSLLSFEMISLSYQVMVSSSSNSKSGSNNNNHNNNGNDKNDNDDKSVRNIKEKAIDELSHISMIGYVSGVLAVVLIGFLVFIISRSPSRLRDDQIIPLSSTHSISASTHSLIDSSEYPEGYGHRRTRYAEDEVFRFR